jgi:hypothetical protein
MNVLACVIYARSKQLGSKAMEEKERIITDS